MAENRDVSAIGRQGRGSHAFGAEAADERVAVRVDELNEEEAKRNVRLVEAREVFNLPPAFDMNELKSLTDDIRARKDQLATARADLEPSGEIQYLPKPENELALQGDQAVSVAKLWAKLDEHDDVQKCHTNASLPDDVMEEHGP